MLTLDELKPRARCGFCGCKLNEEARLSLMETQATWEVPTWDFPGNQGAKRKLKAVGILCIKCIKEKKEPLEAIEVGINDTIIYHNLVALEVVNGINNSAGEKSQDNS